jgi:fermentation-respiration switch protein FrsA (DUF1100 family)
MSEIFDEFFEYDSGLPLEVLEAATDADPSAPEAIHVTYTSARDQRVTALLTLPQNANGERAAAPPYPVVLILHGVWGHKTSPNQVKRSEALVRAGYATLRIDAQYSGERTIDASSGVGLDGDYCYRNRDAVMQTVIDLMRGVDFLGTRDDIDPARIGFAGFSMGGMIGTIFCALEDRIGAVALGITGGGFDKLRLGDADKHEKQRLLLAYRPIDPVNYAARISPRPLLMVNAAADEVIPRAATEALYEASGDPKRIVWYDCGHANMPDEYLDEMIGFFDVEFDSIR